jgi:hypothetical protein
MPNLQGSRYLRPFLSSGCVADQFSSEECEEFSDWRVK